MILATADRNQTVVLGDPKASLAVPGDAQRGPPLTEEEIEEYSRIKCYVCGEQVFPKDIAAHSRACTLDAAPNLQLRLDKWCIAAATMTLHEQRAFVQMRRKEELSRVEELEESLIRRIAKLWWLSGQFGFVVNSKWLREWRSFVGVGRPLAETKDRPPGPINNSELFELDGSMRVGLREGVQLDYHVIEQPMWELYMQVYGGGPALIRYGTSGVLPTLSDQPVVFDGDWKDRRPDTGTGRVFDPYTCFGFDGEIRDGFLWSCTGKGLLRNGSHYEGRVVRGLPDGHGREVQPDGTVIEGSFKMGKLHGQGRKTDPQDQTEEGEWEDGQLCGI